MVCGAREVEVNLYNIVCVCVCYHPARCCCTSGPNDHNLFTRSRARTRGIRRPKTVLLRIFIGFGRLVYKKRVVFYTSLDRSSLPDIYENTNYDSA